MKNPISISADMTQEYFDNQVGGFEIALATAKSDANLIAATVTPIGKGQCAVENNRVTAPIPGTFFERQMVGGDLFLAIRALTPNGSPGAWSYEQTAKAIQFENTGLGNVVSQ